MIRKYKRSLSRDKEDLLHICKNLRKQDIKEVVAVTGRYKANELAERLSGWSEDIWICNTNNSKEPVVAFGLCPVEGYEKILSCWLLSTLGWEKVSYECTRFIKYQLIPQLLKRGYSGQVLAVASSQKVMRWLEFLGFRKMEFCKNFGYQNENFWFYELSRINEDSFAKIDSI